MQNSCRNWGNIFRKNVNFAKKKYHRGRPYKEVGIYKRNKKTRTRPRKQERKQDLDQENDQEKKKTLSFFLDHFLGRILVFLLSCFLL